MYKLEVEKSATMKPYLYRVEPNPDYDQNGINDQTHQYLVDFLLDCLRVWYDVRDQPQTFFSEKARCEQVIRKISMLLKRITNKHPYKLKGVVTVDMVSIQKSMVEQLPFFSEETRAHCLRLISDRLREYRE